MRKPIIGVTPLWDAERKSVWMHPEFLFDKDGDSFLFFESFIEACIKD